MLRHYLAHSGSNEMTKPVTKNKLPASEIERIRDTVLSYVIEGSSITNRQLRGLVGINYDQAIFFFNQMVLTDSLIRMGSYSATKYVLPE